MTTEILHTIHFQIFCRFNWYSFFCWSANKLEEIFFHINFCDKAAHTKPINYADRSNYAFSYYELTMHHILGNKWHA